MKAILVFFSITALVGVIIIIVLFIWGIVILVSGKCKIRKYPVNNFKARVIGLIFVFVPVFLVLIYALLYESLNWGLSSNQTAFLVEPIVQGTLFIVGAIGAYYWALSRAKEFQKDV